jgi:S1-C subfamily serine protease
VNVPLQQSGSATATSASESTKSNDDAKGSAMRQLGVTVSPIDAATARQLQLPSDVRGVLVTGVRDGSSAAQHLATPDAGGPDVIMSVEGNAVTTPDELRSALSKAKAGDIVTLRVYNAPAKSKRIERVRLGSE